MSHKLFLLFAAAAYSKSVVYHDQMRSLYVAGRIAPAALCPVVRVEFDHYKDHIEEEKMIESFDWKDMVIDAERFQVGIGVEVMDLKRQLREVADKMVRKSEIPDTPECQQWLKGIGGLNKLNETLTGLKMSKKGWFKRTTKTLKDEGVDVTRMGDYDPDLIGVLGLDSATNYSSRAVEVHRTMLNRRRHGEKNFDEDTLPNWAATDSDFDLRFRPNWWKQAAISRFTTNRKPKNGLKQVESVSSKYGRSWMLDIRISAKIGDPMEGDVWAPMGSLYSHLSKYGWTKMVDEPFVKNLIDRFYNDPSSLTWKKVYPNSSYNQDVEGRWMCGYQLRTGAWIYLRVSKRFSSLIDFMASPGTAKKYPRYRWVKGSHSVSATKDRASGLLKVICESFKPMDRLVHQKNGDDAQTMTYVRLDTSYAITSVPKKEDGKDLTSEQYMELCGQLKRAGYTKVCVRKGTEG